MDIWTLIRILFLVLIINLVSVHGNSPSFERDVVAELLKNYVPSVKPRRNLSESVQVGTKVTLTSVSDIDTISQTMSFTAWIYITWTDDFLQLPQYIESVRVPVKDIWMPDISLYLSVNDRQDIHPGTHVTVLSDGQVLWYPGGDYTQSCRVNTKKYPFDEQNCPIQLGAWQSSKWVYEMYPVDTGFGFYETVDNPQWMLVGTTVQKKIASTYNTTYLDYKLHFRRLLLYPILNVVVPAILLSLLNPFVFLLSADSGEKMTLSVSLLISLTVFLNVLNDSMPKSSSNISYLSLYLGLQLGISVLTIIASSYVIYVYRQPKSTGNGTSSNENRQKRKIEVNFQQSQNKKSDTEPNDNTNNCQKAGVECRHSQSKNIFDIRNGSKLEYLENELGQGHNAHFKDDQHNLHELKYLEREFEQRQNVHFNHCHYDVLKRVEKLDKIFFVLTTIMSVLSTVVVLVLLLS